MKPKALFSFIGLGSMLLSANYATAQEAVVVEETAVVTEQTVECKTHYTSSWRDNWFLQFGAGAQVPITENFRNDGGSEKRHFTAIYNVGFGHWWSPYLGFRFSALYGSIHYNWYTFSRAKMGNLNFDFMWDMTSSICGVNPNRVFSFIPFVGIGGTYTWDFKGGEADNMLDRDNTPKCNEWSLSISAGFQMRFRVSKHVDLFAEVRAQFYADNFNNVVHADPLEANLSAIGGISINFGGRKFGSYNPCDYLGYINGLNGQVNDLRNQLAEANAALAAAQAVQPVAQPTPAPATATTPLFSTVRFKINSDVITPEEEVNVYNIAQWMKSNPDAKVIIDGYADKDTGTAEYNMKLSERRAEAVRKSLVDDYGISADRLSVRGSGSEVQPYPENNWNRIVIFTQP